MKTISRFTPFQLETAIMRMAMRYGQAERLRATATERWINGRGDEAKARASIGRWERACDRRFNALQRLAGALRKQADAA